MCGWLFLHSATGRWFPLLLFVVTIAVETLFVGPVRGFQQLTTVGLPISVRFVGKLFLTPRGDKGRHKDLLPLRVSPNQMMYLQVDDFHTTSKTQGELSLLYDMQRRKPSLRVGNTEILTAFLSQHPEALRGEKIALNGYFYRASGLLMISAMHVEGEDK
jgi:hypothetical protein